MEQSSQLQQPELRPSTGALQVPEPLPPMPAAPPTPPGPSAGGDEKAKKAGRRWDWWPSAALVAVAALGAVLLQVAPIRTYVQHALPRPEVTDVLPPARAAERAAAWDGEPPLETAPVPGRTDLIQVTVWDDMIEDGDSLTLTSGGLSVPVRLTKAGSVVFLPRPADGVVSITANIDGGGGGITLGVMGSGAARYSPILAPGQTIALHVK